MNETITWLLEGPPWVEYRTRIDLLGQPEDIPEVVRARQAMLENPQVRSIITGLADWPGHALKRHNDATHMIHKLVFLSDIGVKAGDPGMDMVIDRISERRSNEGVFKILANTTRSFIGSGEDEWVWMLCDTPSILYTLVKMKADVPHLQAAIDHLVGFGRDNGWPCAVSPEMGRFKGPGRRDDPCPYATLISLKALNQLPEWRDSDVVNNGIDTILGLWEQRKERRPYLFAMGTGFQKLKAPLIWYDILHVLDVLTLFPQTLEDPRLKEMLEVVRGKVDPQQRFTPESIWKAWSEWDFGQKKEPSTWITFLTWRILKRAGVSVE
ncbi:MAG: hypothetical protein JSU79_01040 [Dehalococcoidales bacterium]|nr:MAG: hypothetical protein JSU79_01040 [Dehalococcoidales bacterium]